MVHSLATAYHMVSDREYFSRERKKKGTNPDADLGGRLVHEGRRQIYITQLHMSSSCVNDRYAESPVCVKEKNGHTKLGLIYVAAPIALTLRGPKLLRHNGTTTGPNGVIENPGVPILRTNGRTEMRRRDIDSIDATPAVTVRSDRSCVSPEEMDYIEFRIA